MIDLPPGARWFMCGACAELVLETALDGRWWLAALCAIAAASNALVAIWPEPPRDGGQPRRPRLRLVQRR